MKYEDFLVEHKRLEKKAVEIGIYYAKRMPGLQVPDEDASLTDIDEDGVEITWMGGCSCHGETEVLYIRRKWLDADDWKSRVNSYVTERENERLEKERQERKNRREREEKQERREYERLRRKYGEAGR